MGFIEEKIKEFEEKFTVEDEDGVKCIGMLNLDLEPTMRPTSNVSPWVKQSLTEYKAKVEQTLAERLQGEEGMAQEEVNVILSKLQEL